MERSSSSNSIRLISPTAAAIITTESSTPTIKKEARGTDPDTRNLSMLSNFNNRPDLLNIDIQSATHIGHSSRSTSPVPGYLPQVVVTKSVDRSMTEDSDTVQYESKATLRPDTLESQILSHRKQHVQQSAILYQSSDRKHFLQSNLLVQGHHLNDPEPDRTHAQRVAQELRIKHNIVSTITIITRIQRIQSTKQKVADSLKGQNKSFFRKSRDVHMPLTEFFNNYTKFQKKATQKEETPVLRPPFRSIASRQSAFRQSHDIVGSKGSLQSGKKVQQKQPPMSKKYNLSETKQLPGAISRSQKWGKFALPQIRMDDPFITTRNVYETFTPKIGDILMEQAQKRRQIGKQISKVAEESIMFDDLVNKNKKEKTSPWKKLDKQNGVKMQQSQNSDLVCVSQEANDRESTKFEQPEEATQSKSKSPTKVDTKMEARSLEQQESRESLFSMKEEDKQKRWAYAQEHCKYEYLTPSSVTNITKRQHIILDLGKKENPLSTKGSNNFILPQKSSPKKNVTVKKSDDNFVIFNKPIFYRGAKIIDSENLFADDLTPRIMIRNELFLEKKQQMKKLQNVMTRSNNTTQNQAEQPVSKEFRIPSEQSRENGTGTANNFDSLAPHHLATSNSNVSLQDLSPMSRGSNLQQIIDKTVKPVQTTTRYNKNEFKNAQIFCQKLKKRQQVN